MSESTVETQANGRFKPGESGNPAGRPRVAKNKTTLLAEEAMAEKVGAVVDKLVERALAGSTSAIRQFLDRNMPVPRGCIGFDLPDLRGPRGIADAQEALIIAVAARQVPPRDAGLVMNLIDRFKETLQDEARDARYAALEAARQQPAAAEVAPVSAAAAEDPVIAAPDLSRYARMDWPQLIDAMWDAEEAERKAALVAPPAEARAADAGDRAPDSAVRQGETVPIAVASAGAKPEINRNIQPGDARPPVPSSDWERAEPPAGADAWSRPVVPFDENGPPPYVDMSEQATSERLRAARARFRDHVYSRAAGFA